MTRFRVAYDSQADGAGEVTRHQGRPLDETTARELADKMRAGGGYDSATFERHDRPGARWTPCH